MLALATAIPGGTARMILFLATNGFLGGGWVTMDKAISGDIVDYDQPHSGRSQQATPAQRQSAVCGKTVDSKLPPARLLRRPGARAQAMFVGLWSFLPKLASIAFQTFPTAAQPCEQSSTLGLLTRP